MSCNMTFSDINGRTRLICSCCCWLNNYLGGDCPFHCGIWETQNIGSYARYISLLWQEKWAGATGNSNSTSKKAHRYLKMTNFFKKEKKFLFPWLKFHRNYMLGFHLFQSCYPTYQLYMSSQHAFQKVNYTWAERDEEKHWGLRLLDATDKLVHQKAARNWIFTECFSKKHSNSWHGLYFRTFTSAVPMNLVCW